MQNIHTHAWDPEQHIAAATRAEADRSRGGPMDLSTDFDQFMADAEPFEKTVVFGLKARLTGYWVPDDYVADFVARAPQKLVGFACCDPTQDDALAELRRAVEDLGMVGVKMVPMYAGFDPRDERCRSIYAYCQEQGLPILFHSGTTFNSAAPLAVTRPWLFDEVAIHHPELRMVLAHVGHPFTDECLVVIRKHPHVYADISALFYRPWQFYNMLISAQEYHVTDKLLFGTDYPFARSHESIDGLRNANAVIGDATLPQVKHETIEGILQRDAFGLLGDPQMKALLLEDVGRLVLTDVPVPTLGEDELLVETAVSTICTSDLNDIAENPFGAPLPLVPGHEGAGTVVRVGSAVTGFAVGDRVATHPVHHCGRCSACTGGMAHLCMEMGHFGLNMPGTFGEYYVVRQDRARPLPEAVSFEQAALVEPICVCLEALAQADLGAGQRLLIIGDGPFGVIMARLAAGLDLAHVVIAGYHAFRLGHATGAAAVNTRGVADPVAALLAANAGGPYDAVILAAASPDAVREGIRSLRRRGRLVIFASLAGETPVDLMAVQIHELEIVGACNDADRFDEALRLLADDRLQVADLITHRFAPTEYHQAFATAAERLDEALKVALLFGETTADADATAASRATAESATAHHPPAASLSAGRADER